MTVAPRTAPSVAHDEAVAAARARLAALPSDAPVRLKKRTSNLFRFRDGRGGLEVDGLDRVLHVDPEARTADVGGMTTYEDLVAATLPHGLMPLVVPQLKTITLGGAVVGLGIESTSFTDGLPHESVLSADVLTGAGEIVTATPDNEAADLWAGLANSYGTLGYAVALRIELAPVRPFVRLRHVRFDDAASLAKAVDVITVEHAYDGEAVDFVDGTVFGPTETSSGRPEQYLTLGRMVSEAPSLSDYTGQDVYYRSIPRLADAGPGGVGIDHLSIHDYLWRWDTDWFWCSRALGAQHPALRRLWPGRYRRSDVYRRLVALDRRLGLSERVQTRLTGAAGVEPIVQDVEVPVERLAEFLDFFHTEIGISPVWVCPLRLRQTPARPPRTWPLYPLEPHRTYVNVGFWSDALLQPGMARDHHNRLIERRLMELEGHKSLYSTASYTRQEFDTLYGGEAYRRLKSRYDPAGRLPELYEVRHRLTRAEHEQGGAVGVAELFRPVLGADAPITVRAYDGSVSEPAGGGSVADVEIRTETALAYLAGSPNTLGLARAYVSGHLDVDGDLYTALTAMSELTVSDVPPATLASMALRLAPVRFRHRNLAPPPQEHRQHGWMHSKARDAEAIAHHYDVSNRFYELVLGPSMAYTCAAYPSETSTLEEAQFAKHALVADKLALQPGMRLLDVGCGWGQMSMHAAEHHGVQALGVTLSRDQALWAQKEVARRGLSDLVEIRHGDYRDVTEGEFDAVASIGLTEHIGRAQLKSYFSFLYSKLRAGGRLLNHCITRPDAHHRAHADPFIDRYVFPDGELLPIGYLVSKMNGAGFEIRHEENLREHYSKTLKAWTANLEANWDECVAEAGQGRARVWNLYMPACAVGFDLNNIQLHQVLGVRLDDRGRSGFPLRPAY